MHTSAYAEAYIGQTKKAKTTITKDGSVVERCRRASGSAELNVNNVRARINTGGNMWYDGNVARYYVPADGTSTAMFCAALWIGGQDENKQIRVAALRFGQDGDDFWPGPLTVDNNASVNKTVCEKWDKHFRITKAEVQAFVRSFDPDAQGKPKPGSYDKSLLTDAIKNWPAHGDEISSGTTHYLAPFKDVDGDGEYNPENGDYPYYDFKGDLCPAAAKSTGQHYNPVRTMEQDKGTGGAESVNGGILVDQVLKGDQTLWWVFNDKGNSHTESKSSNPIGLEIRAQAFAFSMNNEINNMTFYSYEIINRSIFTLTETYFSQWVDPDLGFAKDDYVGCDVKRGLGYCYNGKSTDGPGTGAYSGNPPAIGIDFFQGPYLDADGMDNPKVYINLAQKDAAGQALLAKYYKTDSTGAYLLDASGNKQYDTLLITANADEFEKYWYDPNDKITNGANINGVNFGDGIIDNERFGMRRFVYYENSTSSIKGEPDKATDYYYYLRGQWRTGVTMTYGGDGTTVGGVNCDFMFPGTTDVWDWGTKQHYGYGQQPNWTEQTAGNSAGDRRFMQSAGPFTLTPGAINYITVGIPFAQAASGGPFASVTLLRQVDDKCQALFDNCFNVLEGPDAPDLTVQEMNRELVLYLTNDNPSTNNPKESFFQLDLNIPVKYVSTLTIDTTINGFACQYSKPGDTTYYDQYYHFEGYQIFQLKDATVSVADIYDEDKSRLVAQCDLQNYDINQSNKAIAKLVNYTTNTDIGALVPQVMVDGANAGISHSFKITEDKFASSNDKNVVNNKKYYYIAVAYAYNNYKQYDGENANKVDGQKTQYLASRKAGSGASIVPVVAIPHIVTAEQNGTVVRSTYGECPEITRIEGNGNGGMVLNLQSSTIEKIMGKANEEPTIDSAYITNLLYEKNYGPVNIKVIDPLKIRQGSYLLKIIPDTSGKMMRSTWEIRSVDGSALFDDTVYVVKSDTTIGVINERLILQLGISISLNNPEETASSLFIGMDPYSKQRRVKGGDLTTGTALSSSITFKDNTKKWLGGIADNDASIYTNWIRSGSSYTSQTNRTDFLSLESMSDVSAYLTQDYCYTVDKYNYNSSTGKYDTVSTDFSIDENADYESFGSGWWAPYRLVSLFTNYTYGGSTITLHHPGFSYMHFGQSSDKGLRLRIDPSFVYSTVSNNMNNLASVDVVFTSDTTKWTRCPVIEMGTDPSQTQGNAKCFQLRKHASVYRNGKSMSGSTGMGWFPGYAINIETGQRLNMIFGENSQLGGTSLGNGGDMIWNPTSSSSNFGGMHYIYVIGANNNVLYTPNPLETNKEKTSFVSPSYYDLYDASTETVGSGSADMGRWAYDKLRKLDNLSLGITSPYSSDYDNDNLKAAMEVFTAVTWVGMPLATAFDSDPNATIPTDVTVSLRVRTPYRVNYTNNGQATTTPQNNNYPMYKFTITKDIATSTGNTDVAKTALDQITVVPNPYFAASLYESDQVDNLVRITNLPPDCYITIYSLDGTVIRKLRGPSKSLTSGGGTALTSVDWDLKNHKGLPISGGVYMIHIKADGVGEKIIKWFGAIRPVDLNSFQ